MTKLLEAILSVSFPPQLPQVDGFEHVTNHHDPMAHEVTECGVVGRAREKIFRDGIERTMAEAS